MSQPGCGFSGRRTTGLPFRKDLYKMTFELRELKERREEGNKGGREEGRKQGGRERTILKSLTLALCSPERQHIFAKTKEMSC